MWELKKIHISHRKVIYFPDHQHIEYWLALISLLMVKISFLNRQTPNTHSCERWLFPKNDTIVKDIEFWNPSAVKTQSGGMLVDSRSQAELQVCGGHREKTPTENRSFCSSQGCNYMNKLSEILHIYHFLLQISIEKRQVWTPRPKGLYFVEDQHYLRQRPPSWPQKQPVQSHREIPHLNFGAGVGRC